MKGFIISAGNSGAGKTLITLGIMKLFNNISPFKVGPDFIDPSYHALITGKKSYNLDLFMMGEDGVKYSFFNHCNEMNIVEGVMGLYDGIDNTLDNYSTAHLSRVLNLPVILVINAKGRGITIAAEIMGYKNFDSRVNIAGVILNKIGSEKTYHTLKKDVENYSGVKCLGFIKENSEYILESRHLGLLLPEEINGLNEKIQKVTDELSKTLDVKYIEDNFILNKLDYISFQDSIEKKIKKLENKFKNLKVGIARDKAFSFYYEDNIEILKKISKEVIYFSPINDKKIPDVDVLYFGGGYPENHIKELSSNCEMLNSIRAFHTHAKKIFAECGGFIYLSNGLYDLNNNFFPLCKIADCEIKMFNKLDISRFGYIDVDFIDSKGKLSRGKGHEFHYSQIVKDSSMNKSYRLLKKNGKSWGCGYSNKNSLGGYPHLHFLGSMEILEKILEGVGHE